LTFSIENPHLLNTIRLTGCEIRLHYLLNLFVTCWLTQGDSSGIETAFPRWSGKPRHGGPSGWRLFQTQACFQGLYWRRTETRQVGKLFLLFWFPFTELKVAWLHCFPCWNTWMANRAARF